jgi:hypothetical protein
VPPFCRVGIAMAAQKIPAERLGFSGEYYLELLHFHHVGSLRPFLTVDNLEFDYIPFLKALVTLSIQSAVVNEHIGTIVTPDKTKALSVIEPLYGSFQFHFLFLRATGGPHPHGQTPFENRVKQVEANGPDSRRNQIPRWALADRSHAC